MTDGVKEVGVQNLTEIVQTLAPELLEKSLTKTWRGHQVYIFDLKPLRFGLREVVPFLVLKDKDTEQRTELTAEQVERVCAAAREYVRDNPFELCVVPVAGRLPGSGSQTNAGDGLPSRFAILDGPALEAISGAKDRARRLVALGTALRKQMSALDLSPYLEDTPATGSRFFGRAPLLRSVLAGGACRSFTFAGPRRIGKTSILKEIRDRLKAEYKEGDDLLVAEIMSPGYHSSNEVLYAILSQLSIRVAEQVERRKRWTQFPETIKRLAANKRIVVLIDELDDILEFDESQNFECLKTLRAAFDHPKTQLLLAGFRQTARARYDSRNPLFGFTEFLEIGPKSHSCTWALLCPSK
jgi:hypothetical protein